MYSCLPQILFVLRDREMGECLFRKRPLEGSEGHSRKKYLILLYHIAVDWASLSLFKTTRVYGIMAFH